MNKCLVGCCTSILYYQMFLPFYFPAPPPSCLFYPGCRIDFCQGGGGRKDYRGEQKISFRFCNSNIHYMYISKSISIMVQFEGPCHTHTHISWGFGDCICTLYRHKHTHICIMYLICYCTDLPVISSQYKCSDLPIFNLFPTHCNC